MNKQRFIVIDLAVVAAFATLGRATHGGSLNPQGIFRTAWPFLTAMLVSWAVLLLLKRSATTLSGGLVVWIATVAGGMGLRRWSGDGTALAFIIVATGMLGLLLMGWRLVYRLRQASEAHEADKATSG